MSCLAPTSTAAAACSSDSESTPLRELEWASNNAKYPAHYQPRAVTKSQWGFAAEKQG